MIRPGALGRFFLNIQSIVESFAKLPSSALQAPYSFRILLNFS